MVSATPGLLFITAAVVVVTISKHCGECFWTQKAQVKWKYMAGICICFQGLLPHTWWLTTVQMCFLTVVEIAV